MNADNYYKIIAGIYNNNCERQFINSTELLREFSGQRMKEIRMEIMGFYELTVIVQGNIRKNPAII